MKIDEVNFINFNGIEQYARVMYNDVKDSDKYRIEVAYNEKDIKALLEYLFSLEERIDKAIEYVDHLKANAPDEIVLDKILKILEGK